MGYHEHDWGGGQWLAMSVTMLLLWALLVGLVVWAVRSLRAGDRGVEQQQQTSRADELLAERYARGEIDEEEFLRRRELLRTTSGPRA
ncbi:MAG: SHOCT domain-containing protein [Mycobacteriales bacterium]